MSDTKRPWHGAENPYEAIWEWAKGEIARLEGEIAKISAPRSERAAAAKDDEKKPASKAS
jgi:hypothetical protein